MDDGWFARINVQDRRAAKHATEEASTEWQNDMYTGHVHPANKKTLKMFLAECGACGDLKESFRPRRSYDFEDSDSDSRTDHYESNATGSDDTAGSELDRSGVTGSEDGSQEENEEGENEERTGAVVDWIVTYPKSIGSTTPPNHDRGEVDVCFYLECTDNIVNTSFHLDV